MGFMGLLDGFMEVASSVTNTVSKRIDNMSDSELEAKFKDKTAQEVRAVVTDAHQNIEGYRQLRNSNDN